MPDRYDVWIDVANAGDGETYRVRNLSSVGVDQIVQQAQSARFVELRHVYDDAPDEILYVPATAIASITAAPAEPTARRQADIDANALEALYPEGIPGRNQVMRDLRWGAAKASKALAAYRSLKSKGGAQ